MLVRMAGCDADMEFSEDLLEMIAAIEKAFPAPEYSVMFADAQDEEEDDTLTISRRYGGVLIPMVYVTVDELDELQADGVDWVAQIASDLARTQEQVEAEIEADDAEESE
ncbi:MAG: hypothetical protein KJ747_11155 [Actinobacteria bacterium]|nr:hypothetical protein [Actinomycetota bacterium]MCG2807452.1 hypothetical protein [Coriobacteriia bacterium]